MTIQEILANLDNLYPDAHCELNHSNSYQMAVAVILSAQTTDASVNKVTPRLFKKYPTIQKLAKGKIKDIESCIASLGLYHNKAKMIQGFADEVVERFNGKIPQTISELVTLPGVGRKCANVILSECFNIPALAVDTHVDRISKRLKLANNSDTVEAVERKLKKKVPKERWIKTHHQMIFFGRYLCHSRNPECERCPFTKDCRYFKKKVKA